MSARDWAVVGILSAGGLVLLVLSFVVSNLFRVVTSVKDLVDGVRKETVPLINEVGGTVRGVNREIDRVDAVATSVQRIVANVETISDTVRAAITHPIVKGLAFLAGAQRAGRRFKERK